MSDDNLEDSKDNEIHLCDTCIYDYPTCEGNNLKFGNGKGNDNIIFCTVHQEEEGGYKLYWISWWQPTEDCRPLVCPPNERVLGWWKTGESCGDEGSSICALVVAFSQKNAEGIIKIDWPEADNWRFCEEKENTKLSDRFPPPDWTRTRIDNYNDIEKVSI